jgi:Ca-activated chloride channel homolog
MQWASPYALFLFLISLALGLFYVWAFVRQKKIYQTFAQKELLVTLLAHSSMYRKRLKAVLLLLGVFFCTVALARPQWGFTWQEIKHKGLDIMIALDTSKSMLAADMKPTRLERSKLAIADFIRQVKGDRLGLIAFAGTAFTECPLTVDYGGFLLALNGIDTTTIPRGGTSLSAAIKEALRSFPMGQQKYKALIIVTDGEDHEGEAVKLAEQAAKEGLVIYCIGVGTQEGELISVEKDDGSKEFVKDEKGNVVKSRLNEELLKQIALATGGTYVRSTGIEFGLDVLYKEKLSHLEKREFEGRLRKKYTERFQIPLLLGLLCLMAEALIKEGK